MIRPRLNILTFHRILSSSESYFIPPMALRLPDFISLVERLASSNRIVSLEEGVQLLQNKKLTGNKVALTFDDGYLDNYTFAREELLRIGVPATFYVPINPIETKKPYWWDFLFEKCSSHWRSLVSWAGTFNPSIPIPIVSESGEFPKNLDLLCRSFVQSINRLPENIRRRFLEEMTAEFGEYEGERLLMDWNEILQLCQEGFDIGAHGVTHTPLTDLDDQSARMEIVDSCKVLTQRIGQRPIGFCFPRGAFQNQHLSMVRDHGYRYAVTTTFGTNYWTSSPYALKRRNISDYFGVRANFPVAMHLLELSGCMDRFLATRRSG